MIHFEENGHGLFKGSSSPNIFLEWLRKTANLHRTPDIHARIKTQEFQNVKQNF
jgi:hypothetical protein